METTPTIVILPGWGGSKETWGDFASRLREHYQVEILELPCFGEEPCPDKVWGVKDYAKFVEQKLGNINKPIVLLGHSFGGQVAASVAARNIRPVEKLILSGPAIIRPKKWVRRLGFGVLAKVGKLFFKSPIARNFIDIGQKILYKLADSPDYKDTDGIKSKIFKKVIRQDQRKILHKIKTPTLVVAGKKDRYVPLRYSKRVAKKIKNATLCIFSQGQHGLHMQMPEKLQSTIKNFLE